MIGLALGIARKVHQQFIATDPRLGWTPVSRQLAFHKPTLYYTSWRYYYCIDRITT